MVRRGAREKDASSWVSGLSQGLARLRVRVVVIPLCVERWWSHCIDWTAMLLLYLESMYRSSALHSASSGAYYRFRLSSCLLRSTQILYTRWMLYARKPLVSTLCSISTNYAKILVHDGHPLHKFQQPAMCLEYDAVQPC